MALGRVEAVVGQERHPDQLLGLAPGQPEAVVEQRRPHAEGDGQAVGPPLGPEDAGLGRRVGGVAPLRPGLHQPPGLVGEVAQAAGQAGPVLVDQVEAASRPKRAAGVSIPGWWLPRNGTRRPGPGPWLGVGVQAASAAARGGRPERRRPRKARRPAWADAPRWAGRRSTQVSP